MNYKHTQQDKLTPQRETALSLWKEIGHHSTQPHVSSHPDVIEGASCRPGVCSPSYAGVWAVPQVRLKLTFGNIYQDCVYRQLKEKSTFTLSMFSRVTSFFSRKLEPLIIRNCRLQTSVRSFHSLVFSKF